MPEQTTGEAGAKALTLSVVAFTHVGAVRARNEDTIAVDDWVMSDSMDQPITFQRIVETPMVCLVADGMGGHAGGDVASRLVAECLAERADEAADTAALEDLLRAVDRELFVAMRERPALNGMGTTVAGMRVAPSGIGVFNVGDSRLYRIEPSGLIQLSTDDTPGPKLADGRTAAQTTSILSQSLGGWHQPGEITPHVLPEAIEGQCRYLVCSDGLTDLLDPEAIARHIGDDDGASVTALFQAAMAAGGHDNVSILMVRVRPA
jgi:serine/threonine protein phosphatase PrpC